MEAVKGQFLPVRVRSRVKPSRFHSLMVLSAEVVTICLLSGLNKHFKTCLPATLLHSTIQVGPCSQEAVEYS